MNHHCDKENTPLMHAIHTVQGFKYGKTTFLLKELFRAGYKINVSNYDLRGSYYGKPNRDVVGLLLAAGEQKMNLGKIPKYLRPPTEMNLKNLCRNRIRRYLLDIDPHENLLLRVSRLEIPVTLHGFLLYNQTLEHDEKYDDYDYDIARLTIDDSCSSCGEDDNGEEYDAHDTA